MNSNSSETIFVGDSEMAMLMRSHDWSQTPLGSVETWPQSLRTTVSLCLESRSPIVIWWGDDLTLLYNDAWRPILGSTKHPWALGRSGREVWAEIWNVIEPQLTQVFTTGQATWCDDLLLMMERSGYVEETYFTYSYSPIRLETGEVGGAFAAVTETTRRFLGERRLKTLRDLAAQAAQAKTAQQACQLAIQTLAENPADIPFALLYLLTPDGKQAQLCGSTALSVDAIASPSRIDLAPDGEGMDRWSLTTVARTGQTVLIEDLEQQFGPLPSGPWSVHPQQALVLPLRAAGQEQLAGILVMGVNPCRVLDDDFRNFFEMMAGHIATAIANARAYEEERKRSEALAELDRAKTTFFNNVSHEFRTPLTLMLGPLEETLSRLDGQLPPMEREQLQMVQRNGLRLLKLVNTLLDFSRIEAGRIQAVYEPTDLAAFTAELASVFRSAIEQAGLRLVVDCPSLPELVYVDRQMWEKIVLNLLSNAFKFTFEGEIRVSLCSCDAHIQLEVRDTGTVIPAEELPHIFERFHRVKGARGRSYEGSGIGLSLVQELVRLHGGTIEVSSIVDQGTCFTVSISTGCAHLPSECIHVTRTLTSTATGAMPYVEEILRWSPKSIESSEALASELSVSVLVQPRQPSSLTARILLADDNADMRDYVKRLLSQQYKVEAVADGVSALAAIRQQLPDLVLTDVMMPELDGFELLRELRADPQTKELPIILLSARAGEESRIEGLKAGADDYLIKPFSARELLARVEANLKLAQLRRDAAQREQALRLEAETAQQKVETILSSISDAFIVLDRDWNFTYVNDRYCKIVGMEREALLGHNVWKRFPDAADSEAHRQFQWALREQTPVQFEWLFPAWNRWFEYRVYPSPNGLTIFLAEITDRKQAEAEIQQLNQQLTHRVNELQTLFDLLPIGVAFAEDPECLKIRINPYLSELTRVPVDKNASQSALPEERPVYSLCRNGTEIAVEDLPMQYAARHNTEIRDEVVDIVHPDGTVVKLLCYCSPLLDEQNKVRGVLGGFVDITQRIQNEAALRESEERLKIALHTGKLGSWQLNLTTGVLESSAQCKANFGLSPEEDLSYQRLFELIHPDDRAYVRETVERAIAKHIDYDAEYRNIWLDGSIHWIIARGRALYAADGTPIRMIGVTLDITERKQAEAALRESEQQLRLATEGANLGLWHWDVQSDRLIWTDQCKALFGLPADTQMSYQVFLNALHPQDRQRIHEMRPVLEDGQLSRHEIEYRTVWPDGTVRWLMARGSAIYDANGKPISSMGVIFDITDRKQAEAALAVQEQRYRYIFEAVNVPIWEEDFSQVKAAIEQLKASGIQDFCQYFAEHPEFVQQAVNMVRLRDVNQAGLRMFNATDKAELLISLYQIFVPETQVVFVGELLTIAAEEPFFAAETILQTLQGDRLHVWVTITFPPCSESYERVLVSLVDISDRVRTEAALRESEDRLRLALESAELGTWDFNPITKELKWDESCKAMFGLPPDAKVTWESTASGIHPDDRDRVLEMTQRALNPMSGGNYTIEYRTVGITDSIERWIAARGQAYFNPDGEAVRFIGTVLNITAQKQAEAEREHLLAREQAAREAAEAANRIKDEFLAVVSHELRSPLNPILGWSKLLRNRQLDEQKTELALEVIERNAKMQAQLINDLLDVSRILRGKLSLNISPVNLVSTIQAAMETVRLAAVAKSIQIHTLLAPQVGYVSGDSGRLQQVVWNLLSNAVKFTSVGGRVDIRLERIDSQAQMTVSDTGKGISPDFLPYVFDHFRQESAATTRRFGGLGLGLAIVRYLVELHGGTVQADSLGEGQGATFTVKLPLMPHQATTNQDTKPSELSLNLHGIKILVVDDDDNTREFLAFLLELHRANVIAVATASSAIATLTQFKPDVLLSDIGMPDVDGYMLMRQVRALPPEQGGIIPAIALTAYAGEIDQEQAMAAGFQRHIAKPIEPQVLIQAIAELGIEARK